MTISAARLSIDLGADPLTAKFSRRSAPDIADVVATAAKVTGYAGGVRAITVDGPAFHNLGAGAAWEIAGAAAAGVAYLRLLDEGGLGVPDALRQISFRLAADDDQFMTIAKLRVLRAGFGPGWPRWSVSPTPVPPGCMLSRRCR